MADPAALVPVEMDLDVFYGSAFPPPVEVEDDLRFHAGAIAAAQDVQPPVSTKPDLYADYNRPSQGEVTGS